MSNLEDIWFTSDSHFGHRNIIKYTGRPFESLRQHDAELTENWNAVVKPSDVVYHLGDFTLQDDKFAEQAFAKLNGKIYVLGNAEHHDHKWLPATTESFALFGPYHDILTKQGEPIVVLPPLITLKPNPLSINRDGTQGFYGPPIVLCHFPIEVWDRAHYGAWHLHGHTHQATNEVVEGTLRLNVGVDAWGLTPVSLGQVIDAMMDRGWHDGWKQGTDYHG